MSEASTQIFCVKCGVQAEPVMRPDKMAVCPGCATKLMTEQRDTLKLFAEALPFMAMVHRSECAALRSSIPPATCTCGQLQASEGVVRATAALLELGIK